MALIPLATRRHMCRTAGRGTVVSVQGRSAPAIFRDRYVSSGTETGLELADRAPQITMTSEDAEGLGLLTGIALQVTKYGEAPVNFTVRIPQPDGTGMTVVALDATT